MIKRKPSPDPLGFLDDTLGNLFRIPKPRRKQDPDYGAFRRLCEKNDLTYVVASDGYVDVEAPDGTRFAIGEDWDQRLARLETILETGFDPGNGELAWAAKAKRETLIHSKNCTPQ